MPKKKIRRKSVTESPINNKKLISVEEQDKHIRKIFHLEDDEDLQNVSSETLKIYYKYLNEILLFPFDAEYSQEVGFMKDDIYQINIKKLYPFGVTGDNEFYGLFYEAREGRRKLVLSLGGY
jgi:hypothetical protein